MNFEYYIQLLTLFVAKNNHALFNHLRAHILSSSYFREEYVSFVTLSQNLWPIATI